MDSFFLVLGDHSCGPLGNSTNGGSVYVGGDSVGPGDGYELTQDATLAPDFSLLGADPNAGHVLLSSFYTVTEVPGDKVDWLAILK